MHMIDGSIVRADVHTEISKPGMSIFDDAKLYYVKNSCVNSVIIYIHMNILKMNFWIFLQSVRGGFHL